MELGFYICGFCSETFSNKEVRFILKDLLCKECAKQRKKEYFNLKYFAPCWDRIKEEAKHGKE